MVILHSETGLNIARILVKCSVPWERLRLSSEVLVQVHSEDLLHSEPDVNTDQVLLNR
jgi:hypothetical protein